MGVIGENFGVEPDKSEVRSDRWSEDEGRKSSFLPHWWTCHLKNAELEAKHQKYKGRVVLRGDIVKDNSGSYAVFTEQGSSASQMTAAKIMDIISRLPGCAGQAADAVSACTPLKLDDALRLLKVPKVGMSICLETSSTARVAKIRRKIEDPGRSSISRIAIGETNRRSFIGTWIEKIPNWECSFIGRGLFLSVHVDDIKIVFLLEQPQNYWGGRNFTHEK